MDNRIERLIEYFESCLKHSDGTQAGLLGHRRASSPMAVICLGKNTMNSIGPTVRESLLRYWPPYRDVLLFAGIEGEEEMHFTSLDGASSLSEKEMQERVSGLFEESPYFGDYTRLLVFYLLDTEGIEDEAQLASCLKMVSYAKRILEFNNQNSVLCMTLNERIGHDTSAAKIRNALVSLYAEGGAGQETVPCTYVVSNCNTNGSFMPKEGYFGRIFADLMILANGSDPYISANLIHAGVKTVGFASRQKPADDIAKACVSQLLKKMGAMQSLRQSGTSGSNASDALLARLGIREDGTFCMLDSYVDNAARSFPAAESLEAFPRRTCEDLDLGTLSAREIDEETFGAWSAYIGGIVTRIEEEIVLDFNRGGNFAESYTAYLKEHYSRAELIWLSEHPDEVESVLSREYTVPRNGSALDSLRTELAAGLLKNDSVQQAILKVIAAAGEDAKQFASMWNELVNTQSVLIREDDILTFYEQKVQSYIDHQGERIAKEFQEIAGVEELWEFLCGEIRQLINSDPIFKASFEDELISRAGFKEPAEALRQISEQLTGDNIKIWLKSSGSALGNPEQLALLLKSGTRLDRTLRSSLPNAEQYYFHDTDVEEAADALNIYRLDAYQLSM